MVWTKVGGIYVRDRAEAPFKQKLPYEASHPLEGFASSGGGTQLWTPLSLTGVQHYWTASVNTHEVDNDVTAEIDQKGTVNLTQTANEAWKPDLVTSTVLNNKLATRHPSGETFLRCGDGIAAQFTIAQPFTVWVVCSRSALDANNAVIGGTFTRWFLRFNSSTQIELYAGGAGAAAAFTSAINTKYIIIAVCNGTSSKIWINGTSVYSGSTNIGATSATDFAIGGETPFVGTPFHGDISESGIATGSISAADVVKLTTYYT